MKQLHNYYLLKIKFNSVGDEVLLHFKLYCRTLLHFIILISSYFLQDDTSILSFKLEANTSTDNNSKTEATGAENNNLLLENSKHDYSILSYFPILSEYQSCVLEYIAGYCIRMAKKTVRCQDCLTALHQSPDAKDYLLVKKKDRGGLTYVGESVKVICKETERAIQKMTKLSKQIVPAEKNIMLALTSTVLKQVMSNYE